MKMRRSRSGRTVSAWADASGGCFAGECDESRGIPNGLGAARVARERIVYRGEWLLSRRHGLGEAVLEGGGGVFEGHFEQDAAVGPGRRLWPSGAAFTGAFDRRGAPSGQGVYQNLAGDTTCGAFREGRCEGLGKTFFANGDVFAGQFRRGKPHGLGERTEEGVTVGRTRTLKGTWKEGKLVEELREGADEEQEKRLQKVLEDADTVVAKAMEFCDHVQRDVLMQVRDVRFRTNAVCVEAKEDLGLDVDPFLYDLCRSSQNAARRTPEGAARKTFSEASPPKDSTDRLYITSQPHSSFQEQDNKQEFEDINNDGRRGGVADEDPAPLLPPRRAKGSFKHGGSTKVPRRPAPRAPAGAEEEEASETMSFATATWQESLAEEDMTYTAEGIHDDSDGEIDGEEGYTMDNGSTVFGGGDYEDEDSQDEGFDDDEEDEEYYDDDDDDDDDDELSDDGMRYGKAPKGRSVEDESRSPAGRLKLQVRSQQRQNYERRFSGSQSSTDSNLTPVPHSQSKPQRHRKPDTQRKVSAKKNAAKRAIKPRKASPEVDWESASETRPYSSQGGSEDGEESLPSGPTAAPAATADPEALAVMQKSISRLRERAGAYLPNPFAEGGRGGGEDEDDDDDEEEEIGEGFVSSNRPGSAPTLAGSKVMAIRGFISNKFAGQLKERNKGNGSTNSAASVSSGHTGMHHKPGKYSDLTEEEIGVLQRWREDSSRHPADALEEPTGAEDGEDTVLSARQYALLWKSLNPARGSSVGLGSPLRSLEKSWESEIQAIGATSSAASSLGSIEAKSQTSQHATIQRQSSVAGGYGPEKYDRANGNQFRSSGQYPDAKNDPYIQKLGFESLPNPPPECISTLSAARRSAKSPARPPLPPPDDLSSIGTHDLHPPSHPPASISGGSISGYFTASGFAQQISSAASESGTTMSYLPPPSYPPPSVAGSEMTWDSEMPGLPHPPALPNTPSPSRTRHRPGHIHMGMQPPSRPLTAPPLAPLRPPYPPKRPPFPPQAPAIMG